MRHSLLLMTFLGLATPPLGAQTLDYARDVRPILSDHCFKCHGPDDKTRKGGVRLDRRPDALKAGKSGALAIVPGRPEASEVVKRIESALEEEVMPPPRIKNALSPEKKAVLRRWIAEGAPYANHWAFVRPQRPAIPEVAEASWPRNPLDRFVLSQMEREGVRPAPEADRATLARRVALDLTGLPPTLAEAEAFFRDLSPDAYEAYVDRLLASPHYGERWARRWLDLARYADTNGYEKDRKRSIWPYRDWVLAALNADMPFPEFTIRQIAGDLLSENPDPVATGFHRNTMINEEGGIDVEEFRFQATVDRVSTTATIWLGLTLGCAQCHSHKYDPFSQKEYYQFFAFLNNADEPEVPVAEADIAQRRADAEAKVAALRAGLAARFPKEKRAARYAEWEREASGKAGHWIPLRPTSAVSKKNATLTILNDDSLLVSGDWPNNDTTIVEVDLPQGGVTALRLEVLPDPSLPDNGPGRAPLFQVGDFLLSEFQASVVENQTTKPVRFQSATQDFAKSGASAAQALDGKMDTGWSILGRVGEAHRAVFVLAEPLTIPRPARLRITLEQQGIHQMTLGRFRLWATSDAKPAPAREYPSEVESALKGEGAQRTSEQKRLLEQYFLETAPELASAQQEIATIRKSMPRWPTTLVMRERLPQHHRTTHVYERGEFLKPTNPVNPGVPEVLHTLPPGRAANRLTMARWLVDPANPLVGRVTVNRHWQAFFGQGLVRTTEDFGLKGELPSHPELLDWLAVEFQERGGSVKELHRLLVTSATYRQTAQTIPELREKDPTNRLLARAPRLRVEAETVRDIALRASGLLATRLGGPSVYPPQPEGANERSYGGFQWPTSTGPDRYRRGLYTFLKRTSPYAMFGLFDAPSGEACVPRRDRSNTPLQALTLLNDPVFVEAARALGAVRSGGSPEERVTEMVRRCLTRTPTEEERADLVAFFQQQSRYYSDHPDEATRLAGAQSPDAVATAAWTAVARVILNLDETITRE